MRLASALIIVLVAAGAAGAGDTAMSRAAPPVNPDAGAPGHEFYKAIVDSFDSPEVSPMGVDWVEGHGVLYHVDEMLGTNVYSIDPDTGVATLLFDMVAVLGRSVDANGITYADERQGDYLYITDWLGQTGYDDVVYEFTTTGTLVDSFAVDGFCSGAAGVCYDGTDFWLSCTESGQIVKCDHYLMPLDAYPHPSGSGGGIDYDPVTGHFYVMDVWNAHVYVCDSDMTVLEDFPAGWYAGNANGLCVGRNRSGRTLFFSNWYTDRIYEIEDEFVSPVDHASWGTVKGTYR